MSSSATGSRRNTRVAAHIYYLADAKDLLKAGIDIFAHPVRDRDIDDEVVALYKQHPNVYVITTLTDRETTPDDIRLAGETLTPAATQKLRESVANMKPAPRATK